METELNDRKKDLKKKLIYLKHKMAKFFSCNDNFIKFSDSDYSNGRAKINAEIMLINNEVTSLKNFKTSTYYFDFEAEYFKGEGIWYEENFYGYENINEFFNKIFNDIEKLK